MTRLPAAPPANSKPRKPCDSSAGVGWCCGCCGCGGWRRSAGWRQPRRARRRRGEAAASRRITEFEELYFEWNFEELYFEWNFEELYFEWNFEELYFEWCKEL